MGSTYPSEFIDCTCTIRERFAPTAFRAALPNGKPTVAFVQRREARLLEAIRPGSRVRCTINPADFDRARITELLPETPETLQPYIHTL